MITRHIGLVDLEAFAIGAPPVYGEHRLDMLYSDLDTAGYMTPAGGLSGIGTPFDSQSRRGSADNLASINATDSTGVPPLALQSRLGTLGDRLGFNGSSSHMPAMSNSVDDRGIPSDRSDSSIPGDNQQSSNENELARRTSDHGSEHSGTGPQHFEFSPEQLSKVPSYSTALRSQTQTAISEVPPTYQSVTRRSPSSP